MTLKKMSEIIAGTSGLTKRKAYKMAKALKLRNYPTTTKATDHLKEARLAIDFSPAVSAVFCRFGNYCDQSHKTARSEINFVLSKTNGAITIHYASGLDSSIRGSGLKEIDIDKTEIDRPTFLNREDLPENFNDLNRDNLGKWWHGVTFIRLDRDFLAGSDGYYYDNEGNKLIPFADFWDAE